MNRGERLRPLARMVDPADDVAYETLRSLGAATGRDVEARLDDLLRHAGDIDVEPGGSAAHDSDDLPAAEDRTYGEAVVVKRAGTAADNLLAALDGGTGVLGWRGLTIPVVVPFFLIHAGAATDSEWLNMPAAATELFGLTRHRIQLDLSGAVQFRVTVEVSAVGAAGSALRPRYSTNSGGAWTNLAGAGVTTGDSPGLATLGQRVGAWTDIDPLALKDVLVSIWGVDGNGTADPRFANVSLQLR